MTHEFSLYMSCSEQVPHNKYIMGPRRYLLPHLGRPAHLPSIAAHPAGTRIFAAGKHLIIDVRVLW